MFSQMDVLLQNETSMQKIGLKPDIYVKEKYEDIILGKDSVIERAVEYFFDQTLLNQENL